MIKTLTDQDMRDSLSSRFKDVSSSSSSFMKDFLAQASSSYERQNKRKMPDSTKMILLQSFNRVADVMQNRDHISREAIMSAVSDIAKVDNPITLAYNLMSILIPNFTYTEVMGLQPIPTKEAPIFYPQITANVDRNNVTKGSVLLGSTNWNENNDFTTNHTRGSMTVTASSKAVSYTAPEGSIIPGTLMIELTIAAGTTYVFDDGAGLLVAVPGFTDASAPGTVNYKTGAVALTLAANAAAGNTAVIGYRYELTDDMKPAQAVLGWVTKMVRAEPYRIRTKFNLDDFFQVKQVLAGYDIDKVLNTSVAGYINKEISGSVFNDLLLKTDADYSWDSANPAGVPWAFHRLSLVQTFVRGGNGIRKNIARSGGNVAVCGTEWMNFIETLGDDLWKPESLSGGEPIGPYVAGTLAGKFKIIKNQDYPDGQAVMAYKKDDVDASIMGGVFIGLYTTNPIAMDDLTTIQGMGTQFGWTKVFDNSVVSLTLV
jgi:hypothetical protein